MSPSDDLDELAENEDPEGYLQRIFDELDTLQSKVDLKIAKLYRQRAWIFADGKPPTPTLRRNIRQALAIWTRSAADYPTLEDPAAIGAWRHRLARKYGDDRLQALASIWGQFADEAAVLGELTEAAMESPHVPHLRALLGVPAYETPQVYFEQLELNFLGVFVDGLEDTDAPSEEEPA